MKSIISFFMAGVTAVTLWGVCSVPVVAGDAEAQAPVLCKAETPVPNPWSKGLPAGWWIKRHEDIMALPDREQAQIVFIGDSITDAWDSEGSGLAVWQREYVPVKAVNLGINCDSTQHVLWRLDHGEMDGMNDLRVAVIQIGTNNQGITRDPPPDIAKGIKAICDRIQQKTPQARILLMAIFPKGFGANMHDEANGLIAKLADNDRIFFIDINKALIEGKGIADRVGHLNATGYEIWHAQISPMLEKLW